MLLQIIMRIAISDHQGRVSPVFDVATHVTVVEYEQEKEMSQVGYDLEIADPYRRAEFLANLQIDALICGAVSRPLELLLIEKGIAVYGRVCGDVAEVLRAFMLGKLTGPNFRLPGCPEEGPRRWRRGCRRGRHMSNNEETS
ncbi:MAG TPA: NifB/NifX family molybdenum-iron cluster-binding protein [Thermogutta sp.]|nr:NifB/NifX family molybdenum-iron cluster-binding protein [Thermogutta sp.]